MVEAEPISYCRSASKTLSPRLGGWCGAVGGRCADGRLGEGPRFWARGALGLRLGSGLDRANRNVEEGGDDDAGDRDHQDLHDHALVGNA